MTNEPVVERFLEAEAEASRLVAELKRLQQETQSYKTARESLEEVAHGLAGLTAEVRVAAENLHGTASSLREIGTPELLRDHEALREQVSDVEKRLKDSQMRLTVISLVTVAAVVVVAIIVLLV